MTWHSSDLISALTTSIYELSATLLKKVDAFSTLKASIFLAFFPALKVKCFQPNFAIFSMIFFINSENATKSKFSQETLNIFSALKFTGSDLAFYE